MTKKCVFFTFLRLIDKTLTKPQAEFEIYADAIANELFTDYKAIEVLATQNQSLFTRLKQWFYRNVIKTSEQTTVLGTKAAQRKTYALMLKAEKAAMNKASGEGIAYSTKNGSVTQGGLENSVNDDIISNDNRAQPNSASSINWVYKSELFSTEENILFHQKISEINQGSKAFDQSSQGEYMLPINNKIVFTNGDYNSPYISRVIEVMVDSMTEFETIRKLVYEVEKGKSGKQTAVQAIELSFGQGRVYQYNSSNNKPLQWSNGRREGNNRREIVERYRRERDSRRNVESGTSSQSANYSAKKSETAQRITENFGYTDATANNIVKAARTLRQKAKLI